MKEKVNSDPLNSGIFKEVEIWGCEGKQWMRKALEIDSKHKLTERLGLPANSPENYLLVAHLGIKLLQHYEYKMCSEIKNTTTKRLFVASPTQIDEAQGGISGLVKAINELTDKHYINFDKRWNIEKAVNWLTAQYFCPTERGIFPSKEEFNPDNLMLEKWQQRWKPQLSKQS